MGTILGASGLAFDSIFQCNSRRDTSLSNQAIERMLFKWEVPLPTEAHRVLYLPTA